jgi:hypothetical protein
LGDQIDRDVSGVGFALDFPGQIMAEVFLPAGAAAVGIAAGAANGDEASGHDRAFGLEGFLAGLEGAADEGGVLGDVHTWRRGILRFG